MIVKEGRRHPVTTSEGSFKTLFIKQVRALQQQTGSQYSRQQSNGTQIRQYVVFYTSTRPEPASRLSNGIREETFCAMKNGDNGT